MTSLTNTDTLEKWHVFKSKINSLPSTRLFAEREIWWCSIGQNIGGEIYGKGDKFSRPVFILKKYSHKLFLGIPLTTKFYAMPFYYPIMIENKEGALCFHQLKTLSSLRLQERICRLTTRQSQEIAQKLAEFLIK